MGRGSSKIGGAGGGSAGGVSPAIQAELDRFNGKTGTIVTRMIERSQYGIDSDEVNTTLRLDLEHSESGSVDVDYYSLKGNIDSSGFADVEVAYDVSTSRYTGSHDLGTGRARMSTTTNRKYKTIRVQLMDFTR